MHLRRKKQKPPQAYKGVAIEESRYESEVSPPQEPLDAVQVDSSKPVAMPKLFGPPEWLMTAAFVVGLLMTPAVERRPTIVGGISIGLCLGLPSMLAGWSSVRSGVWRYVLTVVVSLLDGCILAWSTNSGADSLVTLLPLASALPTLLTLFLIKRFFGRFAPLETQAEHFLEGLRFNLSHLFIVTTVLAVLLAIGKAVGLWAALQMSHPSQFFFLTALVVLFSFNTLIFVWALMGRSAFLRACIAILVAFASIMVWAWFCNLGSPDQLAWYIFTSIPLVTTFLLLVVFRHQGWRFWKTVR